jgi:hypothetical protein
MRYMAAVGYPEERIRNQELNRILRNSLDSLKTCDGCEVGSNYNSTTVVVNGTRKAKNRIRVKRSNAHRSRDQGLAERGPLGPVVGRSRECMGRGSNGPRGLGNAGLRVEAQASLPRRLAKAWH